MAQTRTYLWREVRRSAWLALVAGVVAVCFDPGIFPVFALVLGVAAGWGFGLLAFARAMSKA